jgi:hypothetical protein
MVCQTAEQVVVLLFDAESSVVSFHKGLDVMDIFNLRTAYLFSFIFNRSLKVLDCLLVYLPALGFKIALERLLESFLKAAVVHYL